MIITVEFRSVALDDFRFPSWPGNYSMAWIYSNIIRDCKLDMHSSVGPAPMHISPPYRRRGNGISVAWRVREGDELFIRFSFIRDSTSCPLLAPKSDIIRLGDLELRLIDATVESIEPEKYVEPRDEFELRFITPTLFTMPKKYLSWGSIVERGKKVTTPLPDPVRVASGLHKLIRMYGNCEIAAVCNFDGRAETGCFYILSFKGLSSSKINIGGTDVVGFTGSVVFKASGMQDDELRALSLAMEIARYIGLGSFRTYGCGWVDVK